MEKTLNSDASSKHPAKNQRNFKKKSWSVQGNNKRKFNMDSSVSDKKQKMFYVGERLKENDIGVTEFMNDFEGFSGIVKDKYSDFHVHEIAEDGTIAKLTRFDIPTENKNPIVVDELKKNLPENIRRELEQFLENTDDYLKVEIEVTNLDKEQRKNIHQISKSVPNVISQTEERNGQKILLIVKNSKKGNNLVDIRKRVEHEKNRYQCGGKYLYFILHKVNIDTMDALNQLACQLRINVGMFKYAGTKDRRAKTSQWISLKKGNPYQIEKASKRVKYVFVGNFKFADTPLKLGMLKGNQFTIALKNVTADDETIKKIMTSLKNNGFINYFGLQRFGSIACIPTFEIGKALLQGKWQTAVDLILKPRDEEQDKNLAEARKIYESTKDAKLAFKAIERSDKIEAKLLRGIHLCDNNFQNALDHIPKNTILMYIHSYQSLIWNTIVSRRIKEFGKNPVVGDLVYVDDAVEDTEEMYEVNELDESDSLSLKNLQNSEETYLQNGKKLQEDKSVDDENKISPEIIMIASELHEKVNELESKTDSSNVNEDKFEKECDSKNHNIDSNINVCTVDEVKSEDGSIKSKQNNDKKDTHQSKELPKVKALEENDLPNYTLADIVMPLPGYKAIYPSYAKSWYEEMLKNDRLDTDLKMKNKKYSLSGFYRKVLCIPNDLSWHITHYEDRNVELISSDLDKMRNKNLPQDTSDGKYKALILELSLPSSTYATSALREIMKQDMSTQNQAAKSAAHSQ